ncbi:MAG: PspC domain-containing protein [Bacteroidales bacterium]|nr:PspC domain-containing protein [Bacteroidales bacterium]
MKPVENVSIGGYVFNLEDDACVAAKAYLSELESFYSKEESGAEVMEGIEERMSELLLEKCGRAGVVTLPMVENVIATLGRPEAIEAESVENDTPEPPKEEDYKVKRKLYRDPSNGKVGGVCSGLGTYFGIDPTFFRLFFVVFTLIGCGLFIHRGWLRLPEYSIPILYMALWICMPEAKTVRQRDEMRGEKGTVDAISARVMSAAHEMGDTANKVIRSDSWSGIWKVFGICIGIMFLAAGVSGVVSLGCFAFDGGFLSNTFFLNRAMEELANEAPKILDMLSYPPLVAALAVVIVVPFIAFVYAGVMLIFDLKAPKWRPGIVLFVIWLIALTVLAVLSAITFTQGLI